MHSFLHATNVRVDKVRLSEKVAKDKYHISLEKLTTCLLPNIKNLCYSKIDFLAQKSKYISRYIPYYVKNIEKKYSKYEQGYRVNILNSIGS